MYDLDIIAAYFPDLESIDTATLQSAGPRVDWLWSYFADIEMSPGSG